MRGKSPRLSSSRGASQKSLENSGQVFPSEQPSFFDLEELPAPGSLNDRNIVRAIVTESIRNSEKSREQIAEELTVLLGERVTVRMLNSYTSEAAEMHRWPLQYARAFCFAVSDWTLLRAIAERSGFQMITKSEGELLTLGREYLKQKRSAEQIALLEKRLSGVDL